MAQVRVGGIRRTPFAGIARDEARGQVAAGRQPADSEAIRVEPEFARARADLAHRLDRVIDGRLRTVSLAGKAMREHEGVKAERRQPLGDLDTFLADD